MDRKTILIVDDSQTILMMARSVLQQASYKVVTALNATDGLALAKQFRPDLILIDGIMPEINGIEAVSMLRTQKDTESIPIIMLTSEDDPIFTQAAIASGCSEYVLKPINGAELLSKIKTLLEAR
jgi:DNA-binding response OmpR family regulator